MLRWDAAAREVVLEADRAYAPGDPVVAWCGPQPNARLLINYGIVDEENPYDKLPLQGKAGWLLERSSVQLLWNRNES